MTKRIRQRDFNVARKMIDFGQQLIATGVGLISPDTWLDPEWQKAISEAALDVHSAVREHGRKINVVEKKGQRA